jgi:hypothetical protein
MKSFPKSWAARLLHASALWVGLGLLPASLHAQTNTHQTAGVALGLRGDAVRDDLLVPLGFAGPGFQLRSAQSSQTSAWGWSHASSTSRSIT